MKQALWDLGVRDLCQCVDLEDGDAKALGITTLQLRTLKRRGVEAAAAPAAAHKSDYQRAKEGVTAEAVSSMTTATMKTATIKANSKESNNKAMTVAAMQPETQAAVEPQGRQGDERSIGSSGGSSSDGSALSPSGREGANETDLDHADGNATRVADASPASSAASPPAVDDPTTAAEFGGGAELGSAVPPSPAPLPPNRRLFVSPVAPPASAASSASSSPSTPSTPSTPSRSDPQAAAERLEFIRVFLRRAESGEAALDDFGQAVVDMGGADDDNGDISKHQRMWRRIEAVTKLKNGTRRCTASELLEAGATVAELRAANFTVKKVSKALRATAVGDGLVVSSISANPPAISFIEKDAKTRYQWHGRIATNRFYAVFYRLLFGPLFLTTDSAYAEAPRGRLQRP